MEKITLTGNLGQDVEVKQFDKRIVLNFSLAVRKKELTRWYRCSYWRNVGQDAVSNYLKKGQKILIEGYPEARTYTKDGQTVATIDVDVTYLELLGSIDKPLQQAQTVENNGELYPQTINPFI